MNKSLITFSLLVVFSQLAQSQDQNRALTDERSYGTNQYQPIPQTQEDPNQRSRWWVTVTKPTQYYYTKKGVVAYRYAQSRERQGSVLEGYMGPRSAAVISQGDNLINTGPSIRSYASVSNRNKQGVPMAPRTETPAKSGEKTKRSVKNAETTVQLVQQR